MISVSVIMPSYNVVNYIEESVRSVISQSLRDIEIICVDAGSEDGTLQIIEKLAVEDSRIKVIVSDKKSYGYQVNLGIDEANGEYVSIVETDDYIREDMFEKLLIEAEGTDADIVKCDYFAYWTQSDGERYFVTRNVLKNTSLYHGAHSPQDIEELGICDWYLWNGIYRKSFLTRNCIRFNETSGAAFQDIGFLYKSEKYAKSISFVNIPLYFYCIDRDGASSNSGKGLIFSKSEFEKLLCDEEIDSRLLYSRMLKSFFSCCRNVSESALMQKNTKDAFEWFVDRISQGIQNGVISSKIVPTDLLSNVKSLLMTADSYAEHLKTEKDRILDGLGNSGRKRVIVFGCGDYGRKAYFWLKTLGYQVLCFMDNNKELWETMLDGHQVKKPEKYQEDDVVYLVANELHHEDIRHQLLEMQVDNSRIVIYGDW